MIISIINQKGGVGKSTTAAAMLSGFTKRGYKSLGIDLDPQANLSLAAGVKTNTQTILGVMAHEIKISDAIQESNISDMVCSSPNLVLADKMFDKTGKEYILKECIESLNNDYDFIVIDCPPTLSTLTVNALVCADVCIVPSQADIFSIQGLRQLNETITAVKKYCNPNLKISGVLITRYNSRTNIQKDMFDILKEESEKLGTRVFETKIRESVVIKQAQALQKNLFDMQGGAVEDYNNFIDEFIEQEK